MKHETSKTLIKIIKKIKNLLHSLGLVYKSMRGMVTNSIAFYLLGRSGFCFSIVFVSSYHDTIYFYFHKILMYLLF
jgi:hypothetical protein